LIYVTNGTQRFWVKDPRKIKYYKALAQLKGTTIKILKERRD
jgi:hypothetical protein|tara:strand:- start:73 stop:198 length:126 start_codon:yes stop_codon:yes gene_type:complete